MFGARHYVPILRSKQAEWFALEFLREEDRNSITPLIEITPKIFDVTKTGRKPDPGRVLEDQVKRLLESWRYARFFLDLGLVDGIVAPIGGVRHALAHIADKTRNCHLSMVPVTGLGRSDDFQTAVSGVVRLDGCGACVRLLTRELLRPRFRERLESLLTRLQLKESNVDLLLDCQTFMPDNPSLGSLLDRLPNRLLHSRADGRFQSGYEAGVRPSECEVFAGSHSRCHGQCEKRLVGVPHDRRHEGSGLLYAQHSDTPSNVPRQIHQLRRVCQQELPADRLFEGRAQHCMRIADRSRRQPPIQEIPIQTLNIERVDGDEGLYSQSRSNISTEQALIILKTLGTQPWLGADFEPAVEILIKSLLGRIEVSPQVALTEHPVQVGLGIAQPAVDGFVQVFSFLGPGVTPHIHSHHPSARGTSDELSNLAGHKYTSGYARHTSGTRCRAMRFNYWEL